MSDSGKIITLDTQVDNNETSSEEALSSSIVISPQPISTSPTLPPSSSPLPSSSSPLPPSSSPQQPSPPLLPPSTSQIPSQSLPIPDDFLIKPHVEYLCIYNPDLDLEGTQLHNQILFYYGAPGTDRSIDQQLRHIGLAQGIVALSREFSNGYPVSAIETTHSRILVKKIEEPSWWIVACFNFGSNIEDSKDGRNVAIAEMLGSEIVAAYRRWRLHHGPLMFDDDNTDDNRKDLTDKLNPWWWAWCHNWQAMPTCLSDLCQVDHLRCARGRISSTTAEAASAVIERDPNPSLLQMVVIRSNGVGGDNGNSTADTRVTPITVRDTSPGEITNKTDQVTNGSAARIDNEQTVVETDIDDDNSSLVSDESSLVNDAGLKPNPGQEQEQHHEPEQDRTKTLQQRSSSPPSSITNRHQVSSSSISNDLSVTNRIHAYDDDGFVWTGSRKDEPLINQASICDVVNWIQECQQCGDDNAFCEPSGYVAHLNSVNRKQTDKNTNNNHNENNNTEGMVSSTTAILSKGMASIIPSMSSVANTMSSATVSSVNQLIDLMSLANKSTSRRQENAQQQPQSESLQQKKLSGKASSSGSSARSKLSKKGKGGLETLSSGPSDELSDSRFLVGLRGDLEEEESYYDDASIMDPIITKKEVHLLMNSNDEGSKSDGFYERCQIVIYRRRPFIFALFYRINTVFDNSLSLPNFYFNLHRRLASLSEPFFTDLTSTLSTSTTLNEKQLQSKFYYLTMDHSKSLLQTSLPSIPHLPPQHYLESLEPSRVEKLVLARLEMIHVHQALAHLMFDARANEVERFIRTARSWWIYWTRLSDGRIAMLARKGTKRVNNSADSGGLLGALGKDAKLWLEEYKYHGKV